jgi:filamentous hemagglutinin family protein
MYLLRVGVCISPLGGGLANAQIATDGTTGSTSQSLAGPNFIIGEQLGRRAGNNLLHSFREFSVPSGGSATFQGSASIRTVIARVTGNTPSDIGGRLASDIPQADLVLINPNGIAFHEGATLSVGGSFTATTARTLIFADGAVLPTSPTGADSLTSAPLSGFGFIGATSGSITVSGSDLRVADGQSLNLAGGNIDIQSRGRLAAQSGTIRLASIASSGVLNVDLIDVGAFEALGTITLSGGSRTESGSVLLDPTNLGSPYSLSAPGTTIVRCDSLQVLGRVPSRITSIRNESNGLGNGGFTDIYARSAIILNSGAIVTQARDDAQTSGAGVRLQTGLLTVINGGQINATTFGRADAGVIEITANRVHIDRAANPELQTGLIAQTGGGGSGGNISIRAGEIFIGGNGEVNTSSTGSGNAGHIVADAASIVMTSGAIISDGANTYNAGNILLHAQTISLSEGSKVYADGNQFSSAGSIRLEGASAISVRDSIVSSAANGFSISENRGNGGTVSLLSAGPVLIRSSRILTQANSAASSGDIQIIGGQIALGGSRISTAIIARDGGSTFATSGRSGSIQITASDALTIDNATYVRTDISGLSTADTAGSATLNAPSVTISGSSHIWTMANNSGRSGNITISAPISFSFIGGQSENSAPALSSINAGLSGSFGIGGGQASSGSAGTIRIAAGDVSVLNGAVVRSGIGVTGEQGLIDIRSSGGIRMFGSEADPSFETGFIGNAVPNDLFRVDAPAVVTSGRGADISVAGQYLNIGRFATVGSSSLGGFSSGTIVISVEEAIRIGQQQTGRFRAAFSTGIEAGSFAGDGGRIEVTARTLDLLPGGSISAPVNGTGRGSSISISTSDSVAIVGQGSANITGVFAGRFGSDSSSSGATGRSGDISVRAARVALQNSATIDSSSSSGSAGNVQVAAYDGAVRLENRSVISVRSIAADGGTVSISSSAGDVEIFGRSSVVADARRDGGNVEITGRFIEFRESSRLLARAQTGRGGVFTLDSSLTYFLSGSSRDARSQSGDPGTVDVRNAADVQSMLGRLPEGLLLETAAVQAACNRNRPFASSLQYSSLSAGLPGGWLWSVGEDEKR